MNEYSIEVVKFELNRFPHHISILNSGLIWFVKRKKKAKVHWAHTMCKAKCQVLCTFNSLFCTGNDAFNSIVLGTDSNDDTVHGKELT